MGARPRPHSGLVKIHQLAEVIESPDPSVRRFLAEFVAEFERLSDELRSAEQRCASAEARAFIDDGHRGRLEDLILLQEADISRLSSVVQRAQALVDLARWSATTTQSPGPVVVLVDDLAAALSAPPS